MALLPIVLAVLVGLLVGALRRGRLRAIARTRVHHPEFLVVAIGCSLFIDASDAGPSGAIAVVGLIGGIFFAGANLHLAGMAVIAVGIAANLLPVALNGAMPVRADALVEAEMVTAEELDRVALSGARELEDDDTILAVLGDTYPVRWTGQVVSLGDLIMMVGLADVVTNLMLQRRRRRLPPSTLASLAALGWHEEGDMINLDTIPFEETSFDDISLEDISLDGLSLDDLSLEDVETPIDVREPRKVDLRADEPQPALSSTTASPVQD